MKVHLARCIAPNTYLRTFTPSEAAAEERRFLTLEGYVVDFVAVDPDYAVRAVIDGTAYRWKRYRLIRELEALDFRVVEFREDDDLAAGAVGDAAET